MLWWAQDSVTDAVDVFTNERREMSDMAGASSWRTNPREKIKTCSRS